MSARACACAIWRQSIRAEPCERVPSAVDRGRLGSQAFFEAKAFNANIGAWTTASVLDMYGVCAAFSARRRATAGGTCSAGSSMLRGPLCAAATADACADVWACACAGVHVCRYSCA